MSCSTDQMGCGGQGLTCGSPIKQPAAPFFALKKRFWPLVEGCMHHDYKPDSTLQASFALRRNHPLYSEVVARCEPLGDISEFEMSRGYDENPEDYMRAPHILYERSKGPIGVWCFLDVRNAMVHVHVMNSLEYLDNEDIEYYKLRLYASTARYDVDPADDSDH